LAGYTNGNCSTYTIIDEFAVQCAVALGGNCDVDVDECLSFPCQNGAACTDSTDVDGMAAWHYECACVNGFAGVNCELDINECASGACQNGATCHDSTNETGDVWGSTVDAYAYMCTCVAGFANNGTDQQDCAIDVDECASSPCYNNGTCTDLINNYTCACVSGYRDYDCETHIVPCVFEEDHCSDHSTCVHDAPGVYHCECHPGYSSDSDVLECSMEDYPCTTDPSDEGGDLANGGAACTDINECASSPCQVTWTEGLASGVVTNSDSCNDFVDFYTCTCEDGYAGFNCDVDLD